MKKRIRIYILIIILIILLCVFSIMSIKTYNKYNTWKEHRDYFRLNDNDKKIEDWMNLIYIEDNFNVSFKKEFNITPNFIDKRRNLKYFCLKYHLNETKILNKLNSKKFNINRNNSK